MANSKIIWRDISYELTEEDKKDITDYLHGKVDNLDIILYKNTSNQYGINIVNITSGTVLYNNHFTNLIDLLNAIETMRQENK